MDARAATEFTAGEDDFLSALENAMIDHVQSGRPGKPASGLAIQVWTTRGAGWRNFHNPTSGNIMGVTHEIAGQRESAAKLFRWACNAVQMARDIDSIGHGLAQLAFD